MALLTKAMVYTMPMLAITTVIATNLFDDTKERNRAIFMMDHLEEKAIDERIAEDMNAMFSNLADDDDYGDYDDEESGYLDAIRRD